MNETKLPRRFESGVANAQKCIRVGGKACDLEEVGHDGHHLSFFEMLGNWSFNGSYNRETAIKLAWDLLTNEYKIPKERLFVTYFNGCNKLGLPADEETKELWLANGVESQRILPFGADHNFWQMGLDGPCGPCTEIHFAHRDGIDLKNQVNKSDEVVELWNLVFMENCLDSSGKLSKLPSQHIDTGMGLERLTAVLRGSKSNYDTDLFSPLFDAISQRTKFEPYSGSFNRYIMKDSNYFVTYLTILGTKIHLIEYLRITSECAQFVSVMACIRTHLQKCVKFYAELFVCSVINFTSTLILI